MKQSITLNDGRRAQVEIETNGNFVVWMNGPFGSAPADLNQLNPALAGEIKEKARTKFLAEIWKAIDRDYKDKRSDGTKVILILKNGGTTSAPLDGLTDREIAGLLPNSRSN